jgi:hypothetical protein
MLAGGLTLGMALLPLAPVPRPGVIRSTSRSAGVAAKLRREETVQLTETSGRLLAF